MQFYGRSTGMDAADTSQQIINATLQAAFPCDAMLCAASPNEPGRSTSPRVWIVDPLNGTQDLRAGVGEFSVMIALWQDAALRVGVVYKPIGDVLYYALAGSGAYRSNGHGPERLRCAPSKNGVRVVGTRTPPDPIVVQLCKEDGFKDIEPCGSVGLQCARIAEGEPDLYVHPVPAMAEWNIAAPELIVREAGGSVTDCLGRALSYNKVVPVQSTGILAAHPAVTFRVIPTLARMMNGKRPDSIRRSYGK
jgi:3'(2'), 5'-bisphosphate nucleotidase